jgi:hypothetical protein
MSHRINARFEAKSQQPTPDQEKDEVKDLSIRILQLLHNDTSSAPRYEPVEDLS